MDRRLFLTGFAAAAISGILPEAGEAFAVNDVRVIRLYNVHNHEVVHTPYWRNGKFDKAGLRRLDTFFRDWRTNQIKRIDVNVYNILYSLQEGLGVGESGIHLISGYRSPETNRMLRSRSRGVAKGSLHMSGLAADIRVPGVGLRKLQRAASSLRAGGVGYYSKNNFVHVDSGRIRYW